MRVLGVVVEFNPMHNGHHYFIEQAKKIVNPNITIAVMSSSFSMRGDAMVIDKWSRAKFALDYGIDIVLELPYLASVNSADYFCYNAIKTLSMFSITDIAFGVELDNLEKLNNIKNLISSDSFNLIIKEYLDKGLSYANSSYQALKQLTDDEEIIQSYSLPNNTLAIGYLKAIDELKLNIQINLIKRIANNYFDEVVNDTNINSATSLRKEIALGHDISNHTKIDYAYFNPKITNQNLLYLLRYNFITKPINEFKEVSGVNEGIENRINSFINDAKDYEDLIKLVQTKRYSQNRIKRIFLNILLNINKQYENKHHYYLRILAMNNNGVNYVNTLPKPIKKQIITSFKNISNYLVDTEIEVSKLFGLINNQPQIYENEYKMPYIKGVM